MSSTQSLTVERIQRLGGEHHHGMHHALQKLLLYTLWFLCVFFTWSSKLGMITFLMHLKVHGFMLLGTYDLSKFLMNFLSIHGLVSILAISVQPEPYSLYKFYYISLD